MQIYIREINHDESAKERKIEQELCNFNEDIFLEKDIDQIVLDFYNDNKYSDLPTINFDEPYLKEEPFVSRERTTFKIYVPLIGNCNSLQYKPSSQYLMCYQYGASVDESENSLCFEVNVQNSQNIDLDYLVEKTLNDRRKNIETQYGYLKRDIDNYNQRLKMYIEREVNKLYEKVKLKIEIKERNKKSKYLKIIPKETIPIKIVESHIETKNNVTIPKQINSKPDVLILEEQSYLQIFNNLNELSVYAQRLPKSYNKLDEEDIRDQIINALNLKLKTATASGETFNVSGKTDIIIIDNKIIYFIAECKIWKGKTQFKKAINQLLSYISQDVHYSSLIIFNKNKSDVTIDAYEQIKSHELYTSNIDDNRFLFKHPKNNQYRLELSLVIFNIGEFKDEKTNNIS